MKWNRIQGLLALCLFGLILGPPPATLADTTLVTSTSPTLSTTPSSQSWRLLTSLMESNSEPLDSARDWSTELGSHQFSQREKATLDLLSLGLKSRKPLRICLQSSDAEVRFRAKDILTQVPPLPNSWEIRSWLRSQTNREAQTSNNDPKPTAGPPLNLLLSLLESIEEESLRIAIHKWLAQNYSPNDLPTHLSPTYPIKLWCAYWAGYRSLEETTPSQNATDPLLSYNQLRGRLDAGNAVKGQSLAELVTGLPQDLQWDIETLLLSQEGKEPTSPHLGKGSRAEMDAFVAFWGRNPTLMVRHGQPQAPVKKSLFVCEYDGAKGGRICQLNEAGQIIPSITRLQGPNDFQNLPGGRILIAERHSSQITLRDAKGDILWLWQAPSSPIQCQRLEGGKTFFATFTDIGIVNCHGRTELSIPFKDGIRFATPTPDFGFLVLSSRGVLQRLDARGAVVQTISNMVGSAGSGYWGHAIIRANGNIIAAFAGTNTIVELSPQGDLIRQATVRCPVHLKENENGGLWVCSFDSQSLIELNPQWIEMRRIPLEGRPFGLGRMD